MRLPHVPGPTENSFYYRKFASEFASVANMVSWVWRKENGLSGLWLCFTISRFSILPWNIDISNTAGENRCFWFVEMVGIIIQASETVVSL